MAKGRWGRVLSRGSWPETQRIAQILRRETIGGILLLTGAVIALVWANSPWVSSYETLREIRIGPSSLHLDLNLSQWAADGLLAIFFFVAGLELKREFVAGDLRDRRRAVVPVAAALGGVIAPALLYTIINGLSHKQALTGWAIPTATDIAFALAVLAVVAQSLPTALRTFLLTLAVVDDLIAIVIIAMFYTHDLAVMPLLGAMVALAVFTVLVQRRVRSWWLLMPLAALVWTLVHASGVHATVAGVLLGFAVPVLRSHTEGGPAAGPGLAEHFEHRFRPISAAVVVPIFAFFAAGVTVGGLSGLVSALSHPVTIGVTVGLVVGKAIGITVATWLTTRFTRAELDDQLTWVDIFGLAVLGGIGFTVSLLIGELAFSPQSGFDNDAKIGILVGSLLAAMAAALILRLRTRVYRRIQERDALDSDDDGIPDVYQ